MLYVGLDSDSGDLAICEWVLQCGGMQVDQMCDYVHVIVISTRIRTKVASSSTKET